MIGCCESEGLNVMVLVKIKRPVYNWPGDRNK